MIEEDIESGLTPRELIVMNHLIDAWDNFIQLNEIGNDSLVDFRQAIHTCQRILALRITSRKYSEFWRNP